MIYVMLEVWNILFDDDLSIYMIVISCTIVHKWVYYIYIWYYFVDSRLLIWCIDTQCYNQLHWLYDDIKSVIGVVWNAEQEWMKS